MTLASLLTPSPPTSPPPSVGTTECSSPPFCSSLCSLASVALTGSAWGTAVWVWPSCSPWEVWGCGGWWTSSSCSRGTWNPTMDSPGNASIDSHLMGDPSPVTICMFDVYSCVELSLWHCACVHRFLMHVSCEAV